MKKALLLLVFVGMFGCQYHDSSVQNGPRMDFNATKDNTVTAGDPGFQVSVTSISDSRCPIDAMCIWAGIATVTFQIAAVESSTKNTFSLKIGETKNFSVDQKNYQLTLTDVTPFPTTENGNEEKKAVFTIKQI